MSHSLKSVATLPPMKTTQATTTKTPARKSSRARKPASDAPKGLAIEHDQQRGIDWVTFRNPAYKSLVLRLTFMTRVSESHCARASLVAPVLVRGSQNHPSMRDIARACEELYGASISTRVTRAGSWLFHSLVMRILGPDYLPDGLKDFRRALQLAQEVLLRPALDPDARTAQFRPDIFESERAQLLQKIDAQRDNKRSYAMRQAARHAFAGTPLGIPDYGSREAVVACTPAEALAFHRSLVARAPLAVHLSGPVSLKRHMQEVQKVLTLPTRKPARLPAINRAVRSASDVPAKRETMELEQAYSVLHFASGATAADPQRLAEASFANAILGQLSTSRLFQVVREEHGLAYATGSGLDPATGTLVAYAATDPGQLKRATTLMQEQIEVLQADGFSEEEFEAARNTLIDEELSASDSLGAEGSAMLLCRSCGSEWKRDEGLQALRSTTPEGVLRAMRKLKPIARYSMTRKK